MKSSVKPNSSATIHSLWSIPLNIAAAFSAVSCQVEKNLVFKGFSLVGTKPLTAVFQPEKKRMGGEEAHKFLQRLSVLMSFAL
ncbi:MAG TPA: hypothetical protein DIU26_06830 [Sutterellaceae bacterium]|nr:hypothetical protein [Sutterellaceae bacterium]HCR09555.1 hypothetical protein [Sutterellaceae bacterium]